jgi:hypothetical protein
LFQDWEETPHSTISFRLSGPPLGGKVIASRSSACCLFPLHSLKHSGPFFVSVIAEDTQQNPDDTDDGWAKPYWDRPGFLAAHFLAPDLLRLRLDKCSADSSAILLSFGGGYASSYSVSLLNAWGIITLTKH